MAFQETCPEWAEYRAMKNGVQKSMPVKKYEGDWGVDNSEATTILIGINNAREILEYCKDMCDTIMELDTESSSKPEDLVDAVMRGGLKDDILNIERASIKLREDISRIYNE